MEGEMQAHQILLLLKAVQSSRLRPNQIKTRDIGCAKRHGKSGGSGSDWCGSVDLLHDWEAFLCSFLESKVFPLHRLAKDKAQPLVAQWFLSNY